MSEEPVISYVSSFVNKSVVYVPDFIEVPEDILKESFILEAGHGKLMTVYNKHLQRLKELMIAKGLNPEELFLVTNGR